MKKKLKTKLKKDDVVIVISGKEKGKTGKIINFNHEKARVYVEGVNLVKKSIKKTQENPKGGIIDQEASIHISNVMYFDTAEKKRSRIGYQLEDKDGKEGSKKKVKVRYFKQIKK